MPMTVGPSASYAVCVTQMIAMLQLRPGLASENILVSMNLLNLIIAMKTGKEFLWLKKGMEMTFKNVGPIFSSLKVEKKKEKRKKKTLRYDWSRFSWHMLAPWRNNYIVFFLLRLSLEGDFTHLLWLDLHNSSLRWLMAPNSRDPVSPQIIRNFENFRL